MMMIGAKLVRKVPEAKGFSYRAEDAAGAFVANLASEYHADLKSRAQWVVDTFDSLAAGELDEAVSGLFEAWTVEFQPTQPSQGSGLQA